MSGGSQHPNGRQAQLGAGWSPLQVLQMASYLARAPQAHLASERGVTWHTPTPPHLYHVPAPSPPDPLQAMKVSAAAGNSVFRHSATPPELYRHTPTPPDKHLMRHTPSPGDVKAGVSLPAPDIFPHLGSARDKLSRAEDLLYGRGGVDLSCPRGGGGGGGGGGGRAANGSPAALSVRDAPTINSLIARAPPRHRVDSLLERLAPAAPAPAPAPASVIVQPRAPPTPSPPSADDEESSGGSSKRKRKPERVVRVPAAPPEPGPPAPPCSPPPRATPPRASPPRAEPGEQPPAEQRVSPPRAAPPPSPPRVSPPLPLENGAPASPPAPPAAAEPAPHARRKTNSTSSETIDDIAAMIASDKPCEPPPPEPAAPPVSIDKLKSVLGSPSPAPPAASPPRAPAAPRRRSARADADAAPSPSEARPAEPDPPPAPPAAAASIVDVEDQLEKMFAGLEPPADPARPAPATPKGRKRRKSSVTKADKKRRSSRASPGADGKKKPGRKKAPKQRKNGEAVKEYDSGSNASSGRSRGPYIQIRGPRDSPLSVCVVNAAAGEDEEARRRPEAEWRARGGRGLHCSTLGLRYDAATPDASWRCAFCARPPHPRTRPPLGDLFGPYTLTTDCEEYRALDESERRDPEVWVHEDCAVWAGGVLAAGARVWGLAPAVWAAAREACTACGARGAALACSRRACGARAHLPCARDAGWALPADEFRALCPTHRA
ncbi:nascent polypeptide-associated complex subunit alpha, muscle-specific form isoform X1 [Plutella xylostella]|uniref:nascent polypeptide-associated complex subunit alpha, muscle-specific form isoform X1 n=1 Tax=Plutella xylostella TaxID=51655 RepID=UPI0020321D84|nr:nascent polypeptide-associated complex subunit alpha, muscle-specific form isoform X1 [Plutella xylostella]